MVGVLVCLFVSSMEMKSCSLDTTKKKLAREKSRVRRGCVVPLGKYCPPRVKWLAPYGSRLALSTEDDPAGRSQLTFAHCVAVSQPPILVASRPVALP